MTQEEVAARDVDDQERRVASGVISERSMASYEVEDSERQILNQEEALLFTVITGADRVGDLNLNGVDEYAVALNGEPPIH